jgi:alanyl-tRNA synthetase
VLKRILSEKGGKGGGSATLAQAKLQERGDVAAVQEALGFPIE